jgi:hypothetical protein
MLGKCNKIFLMETEIGVQKEKNENRAKQWQIEQMN